MAAPWLEARRHQRSGRAHSTFARRVPMGETSKEKLRCGGSLTRPGEFGNDSRHGAGVENALGDKGFDELEPGPGA